MIEIRGLTAGYRQGIDVIKGIDINLGKGEIVSIVGRNGSGKSTLLRAILGMMPHVSGQLCIDGTDMSVMRRKQRARRIAYLSQGRDTPDVTVGRLVLQGRFPHTGYMSPYSREDMSIAERAMESMSVSEFEHIPLRSLSGGTRQRAYMAMAICQEAEYILLDEPTSYLDISHQLELMALLRELRADGRGIITVMHDLPLALEYSDRIAVMSEGRLIATDTPSALCESNIIGNALGVEVKHDGKRYYYERK